MFSFPGLPRLAQVTVSEADVIPLPGAVDTMMSADPSCLLPHEDREACGSPNVTSGECQRLGCCYDPSTQEAYKDTAKCYSKSGKYRFYSYCAGVFFQKNSISPV